MEIKKIKIDKIKPNPWNPNEMTTEQQNYLLSEYKRVGYLQPILVRRKGEEYEIIDGEHRWKVAKIAGYKEIECVVIEMSDEEAKITTLNMNRIKGADNPIKLAKLLEELKEKDENLLEKLAMEREEIDSLIEVMKEEEIDISELEEKEKQPKIIKCPKCGFEFEL